MNEGELRAYWTQWAEQAYPGDPQTQQFAAEAAITQTARGDDPATAAATAQWLVNENVGSRSSHQQAPVAPVAVMPTAAVPAAAIPAAPAPVPGLQSPPLFPAPAVDALPRGKTWRYGHSYTLPALGGTIALLLVIAGGVFALISTGHGRIWFTTTSSTSAAHQPGTVPTQAPTGPVTNPTNDNELARAVSIDTSGLPAGWTKVTDEYATEADLDIKSTCVRGPATFARSTARYLRDYSYLLDQGGGEEGHMTVIITVQASVADTQKEMSIFKSTGYQPCVVAAAQDDVTGPGASPRGASVVRSQGPVPSLVLPSMQWDTQTPYTFAGNAKVMHETDIHVSGGRATAHLSVKRCCAPAEDAPWKAMIQDLAKALAANLAKYEKA